MTTSRSFSLIPHWQSIFALASNVSAALLMLVGIIVNNQVLAQSSFSDSFESPSVNSFWNVTQVQGRVSLVTQADIGCKDDYVNGQPFCGNRTVAVHGGAQALEMYNCVDWAAFGGFLDWSAHNCNDNSNTVNVALAHTFPFSIQGTTSIWFLDDPPDYYSSPRPGYNFQECGYAHAFGVSNSASNTFAGILVEANDRNWYYTSSLGSNQRTSIPRTGGWHLLSLTIGDTGTTLSVSIDGTTVLTQPLGVRHGDVFVTATFDTILFAKFGSVLPYPDSSTAPGQSPANGCLAANLSGPPGVWVQPVAWDDFTFTADPAYCSPIAINTQPASQTVSPGDTATLVVNATGGLLQYQWYGPSGPIAGAIGNSYTTPPLTENTAYAVEISDPCGDFAVSNTASITVGNSTTPSSVFFGPGGTPTNPTSTVAEPVNTATGNYYAIHNDFVIAGRMPLVFGRSYNSLDQYSGPLGKGWTHSYNIVLTQDAQSGAVTIRQGDGSTIAFSGGNSAAYNPSTPGLVANLFRKQDGSFTLVNKSQLQFDFDSSGTLKKITNRNGNSQTLAYDQSGHLALIVDSSGRTLGFASDTNGRIVSVTDNLGRSVGYTYDSANNLATYQDATGGVTKYAYDSNHQLVSATDPRGVRYVQNAYDNSGRVILQQNGRGFATAFAYASPHVGVTTVTDPLGNQTQYVYDGDLCLTEIIDAQKSVTAFTYDASNRKTSVTKANGQTARFTYDDRGNLLSITDPLNAMTSFAYDGANDLIWTLDPGGSRTTFSYDALGNLTSMQDASGSTTHLSYDQFGSLIGQTNALGVTSTRSYDSNGNMATLVNGVGNTSTFGYDLAGRLVSVTDGNGHTTRMAYDNLDRKVEITDALGNKRRWVHDAVGNVTGKVAQDGSITAYTYDPVGNLASATDPLGNVTYHSYDANNKRTAIKDGNGGTTVYAYDSLNRLVSVTNALGIVTSYSYDTVGNLASLTDGNGKTSTFIYDAVNRPKMAFWADGKNINTSYGVNGYRASVADAGGITTFVYDALHRATSVTDASGNVVSYGYDAAGRRTSIAYPDGRLVTYTYDGANRLVRVTDWLGRITVYGYDNAGNNTSIELGNGAATTFTYDVANRLASVVNRMGSRVLASYAYTLDPIGNRLQIVDDGGGSTRYAYDADGRLVSWTAPSGETTTYAYDGIGSRVSVQNGFGITSYSHDGAGRLLRAGAAAFTYDGNGNRVTQTTGGTTLIYVFDSRNRLTGMYGGNLAAKYQYDDDGNRISQTIPGANYHYVLDIVRRLPSVVAEKGSDGNIDFQDGLAKLSGSSATLEQFYQTDGLGSIVAVTDATGNLLARYTYDPWGNVLNSVDPLGTKEEYKFTGEPHDPQTGLYFLRNRYYDPTVGEFISKDPLSVLARNVSTSDYAYALNNPVNLLDHSGLASERARSFDFGRETCVFCCDVDTSTACYFPVDPNNPNQGYQALNEFMHGTDQYGWLWVAINTGSLAMGELPLWVPSAVSESGVLEAGSVSATLWQAAGNAFLSAGITALAGGTPIGIILSVVSSLVF
jgi:RHS repeat-associated protein